MQRSLFNGARAMAVIATALVPGCYESDFPLDPAPRLELEEAWLGTWRCLPFKADADEDPVTVSVKRGAERRYDITWLESGKAPERYGAFMSPIGNTRLMNVQEVKADGATGKWVFVRPTLLRPDVLQVQIVDDEAMEGVEKSLAAVRRAIERQLSNPGLVVDFCVCVRARETGGAASTPRDQAEGLEERAQGRPRGVVPAHPVDAAAGRRGRRADVEAADRR